MGGGCGLEVPELKEVHPGGMDLLEHFLVTTFVLVTNKSDSMKSLVDFIGGGRVGEAKGMECPRGRIHGDSDNKQ